VSLRVWTIGHSSREPEAFVKLLKEASIERLLDIRTVPRSRHVPWADASQLPDLLAKNGIVYEHEPRLGGLRHAKRDSINDAWRNASFRGYADHMQTREFEAGLDALLDLARQAPTAIMCAEAVPWRCHRSLVTDALLARAGRTPGSSASSPDGCGGIEVLHILDGGVRRATMTPFAKVEGARVTYPAAAGRQSTLM
jgi:uncharacterized protein (DUF488 family)